jgi:hypothetical protein
VFLSLIVASLLTPGVPAERPRIEDTDRIRLAEAFRLGATLGEDLWPGFGAAPFAVLLVTAEHEFLVRHPEPTSDFAALGPDSLLGGQVWVRSRQYDPSLLATFPAVGRVPTIVIGRAEATTARTSTRWVLTVLHEHFHQLQYSQPAYYAEVDRLGLAKGDSSGMWMLDYAFPYADSAVARGFEARTQALGRALAAEPGEALSREAAAYRRERQRFDASLKPADARYMEFQLWQEGISRYTELRLAELAAERFEPSPEFRALRDFTPFAQAAERIRARIDAALAAPQLPQAERIAFYALGAAEGLLLDRTNPKWRARYFHEMLRLDFAFSARR